MKATTNNDAGRAGATRAGGLRRKITRRGRSLFLLLLPFVLHSSSFILSAGAEPPAKKALVLQSDFGQKDGAVAAMKGVATGVEPDLKIYDLTHEIPAFNVWEGAYRLWQTAPYWPEGTVFVSVVDPGVGTNRKSVVARTKNGQYFVTPDNGTLTLIAEHLGIDAVREIDEKTNRRPGSEGSYTFHGRDVYAYTGARLAAGVIQFEQVGPMLDPAKLVVIPYTKAEVHEKIGLITGGIPVLDPQYGNVWTNISREDFAKLDPTIKPGDHFEVAINLKRPDNAAVPGDDRIAWLIVPYANSFGDVPIDKPLLYFNSLGNLSLAINEGNFAVTHKVGSGARWIINVHRTEKK